MLLRPTLLPRLHVAPYLSRAYAARATPPHPPRRQQPPVQPIDPSLPLGSQSSNAAPATPPSSFAPWIFGALSAGIGFYTLQLYLAASAPCHNPHISDLAAQKDVAARYDYTAASFDSEVGLSELLMGINGLRKKLAGQCKGDVLEVSCGTGRNLGYYDIVGADARVNSLAFIDLSPQMVDVCKKKWAALFSQQQQMKKKSLKPGLDVRFMTGSALGPMPLAPGGRKYTTILQTMGLCSTASPAALLENMIAHLDTSNPESRILLLEHGRSYMPWLNRVLDNAAERHAELHGCWFNREIGGIVREVAGRTGMEVVGERRRHLGTTWVFELRPTEETVEKARASSPAGAASEVVQEEGENEMQGGWLSRLGWT